MGEMRGLERSQGLVTADSAGFLRAVLTDHPASGAHDPDESVVYVAKSDQVRTYDLEILGNAPDGVAFERFRDAMIGYDPTILAIGMGPVRQLVENKPWAA
jgi:hypothetical protein